MRAIRIIGMICIGVVAMNFISCNNSIDQCDQGIFCDPLPIDSNWVNLQLTEQSAGVPLVIYRGNLENNIIILVDTAYGPEYSYYLPTNVRYTAEAYYRSGPNTIIAVDSKELKEETFTNCGETCYESDEITLDLVLIE